MAKGEKVWEFETLQSEGLYLYLLVQLGRTVEQLDNAPIKDVTTKPAVKERKKAIGQKEDDHSGYDFEMKM